MIKNLYSFHKQISLNCVNLRPHIHSYLPWYRWLLFFMSKKYVTEYVLVSCMVLLYEFTKALSLYRSHAWVHDVEGPMGLVLFCRVQPTQLHVATLRSKWGFRKCRFIITPQNNQRSHFDVQYFHTYTYIHTYCISNFYHLCIALYIKYVSM